MQASDIGLVMMGVIAVLGTVISLLDHRTQREPSAQGRRADRENPRS
ncbi:MULTISPECIES: hypothetical protein [unclassified Pseudomonas]